MKRKLLTGGEMKRKVCEMMSKWRWRGAAMQEWCCENDNKWKTKEMYCAEKRKM